ncbi:MAG TPA: RES domain-containing protein [Gemmatimonadota bacterium]|nr:RES domain-containing protein [Gemmatimonadota bacterium]
MLAWRLLKEGYPPLSGEGARRAGGRWNAPGRPLIYCSRNLSLAILEILVHVRFERLPADIVAHGIDVPESAIERMGDRRRKAVERSAWNRGVTRRIGGTWLDERRSLALRVPSVVVPREHNVLINPDHPDAETLRVTVTEPFRFDPRLRT